MDSLGFFESYVAAVETGSLSSAARLRRISQPAISQQITALETKYGTPLLHRTRKGVQMTKAGELLFRRARTILAEHQDLWEDLAHLNDGISGQIKVTTNVAFSQHIMADVMLELSRTHPELKIILSAEDRIVDVVSEGFDLAIRAGTMGQENVVGRRIASLKGVHVATPAYLDKIGRPSAPDHLITLDYIQYRAEDDAIATPLQRGSEIVQAPIRTCLTAQLPELIMRALLSDLGYAKTPYFMVADMIERGELEEVLPEWHPPAKDIFLIYPHRETQTQRSEVFLNAVFSRMKQATGIELLPSIRRSLIAPKAA